MQEKNTSSTAETVEAPKVSDPEAVATQAQKESVDTTQVDTTQSEPEAKPEAKEAKRNFAEERALAPLSRDRSKEDVDDEADEAELEPSEPSETAKVESPKVTAEAVKPEEAQPTTAEKQEVAETPTAPTHTETPVSQREPSRIDTRIVQVAQQIHALRGNDIPDQQELLAELDGMTFEQKREALNTLFSNRRELRGQNEETPDEREAMMDAEVERRMALKEQEALQKQFSDDILATVDAHPELNEASGQFNKDMHDMVRDLVKSGTRASVAWERVSKLAQFKEQQAVKDSERQTIEAKNKELSGAFGATGKPAQTTSLSKDPSALRRLRTSNPKEYNRLVMSGEI